MHAVEQLFMTYFDTEEDYNFFKLKHQVSIKPHNTGIPKVISPGFEFIGGAGYMLKVLDGNGKNISFDDKPAELFLNKHLSYAIWKNIKEKAHRATSRGPAMCINGTRPGTNKRSKIGVYANNGVIDVEATMKAAAANLA